VKEPRDHNSATPTDLGNEPQGTESAVRSADAVVVLHALDPHVVAAIGP
jgi:hypothetical protein